MNYWVLGLKLSRKNAGSRGTGVFFFCRQKTAYEMLRSLVGSEMCIRDRSTDYTAIHDQIREKPAKFPTKYINVLNWDRIVWSLDEIRHRKGWHNLVYDIPSLRQILESDQYELYCLSLIHICRCRRTTLCRPRW